MNERDLRRISLLGRWSSLTAEHIARAEMNAAIWSPACDTADAPESRVQFARAVDTIKHRFPLLKNIQSDPGIGVGPLLGSTSTPSMKTAWHATRIGARTAGLPWTLRDTINPMFAAHAWMAADIGMALESRGYRVLSERELASGTDRHGYRITARLESRFVSPTGRSTGKKPDVAVLHSNGQDYIAVEVERDTDRPVVTYEQKMTAYRANTSVKAVWYICASTATANRVRAAARNVFGNSRHFPLRILINDGAPGFHFLDMDDLPAPMQEDLGKLRATR